MRPGTLPAQRMTPLRQPDPDSVAEWSPAELVILARWERRSARLAYRRLHFVATRNAREAYTERAVVARQNRISFSTDASRSATTRTAGVVASRGSGS